MDGRHRKTIQRYAELFPLSVSQGPKRKAAPSSYAFRFLFQVDRQKAAVWKRRAKCDTRQEEKLKSLTVAQSIDHLTVTQNSEAKKTHSREPYDCDCDLRRCAKYQQIVVRLQGNFLSSQN